MGEQRMLADQRTDADEVDRAAAGGRVLRKEYFDG
jgi:hypothetical protein